jgi:hypothetical protein
LSLRFKICVEDKTLWKFTRDPFENLYGQEGLVETYEKWLKADNERLDIEERERKIAKRLTTANLQNASTEKCRKDFKTIEETSPEFQDNRRDITRIHCAYDRHELSI